MGTNWDSAVEPPIDLRPHDEQLDPFTVMVANTILRALLLAHWAGACWWLAVTAG